MSNRMVVAVIGSHRVTPPGADRASHMAYRVVVTMGDNDILEREVRYREFYAFYKKQLRLNRGDSMTSVFPKRTVTRAKAMDPRIVESRQVMLDRFMKELCHKELPLSTQDALFRLLRLGKYDPQAGFLVMASTPVKKLTEMSQDQTNTNTSAPTSEPAVYGVITTVKSVAYFPEVPRVLDPCAETAVSPMPASVSSSSYSVQEASSQQVHPMDQQDSQQNVVSEVQETPVEVNIVEPPQDHKVVVVTAADSTVSEPTDSNSSAPAQVSLEEYKDRLTAFPKKTSSSSRATNTALMTLTQSLPQQGSKEEPEAEAQEDASFYETEVANSLVRIEKLIRVAAETEVDEDQLQPTPLEA